MRLIQDLQGALWAPAPRERPRSVRIVFQAGRMVDRLLDDLAEGRLNLYAMSLVYTTILSIVPVLAVSFSVLKGFGVHNQLEPTLLAFLAPLGPKAGDVSQQVIQFVDNIQVGVLGTLGLAFLLYTVISLLQKVEGAFKFIWKARRERSLSRRFSDYLSVMLVGPVLVFTALGITGSVLGSDTAQWLAEHEPAKTLMAIASYLVPYLLIVAAFTFIYKVVPYTYVNLRAAFVGALVAGLLWETAGWAFASFIATSASYTAIYSGFAIGIVAIIWLYLAWLILLLGCRIAFYHQHPEHLWVRDADTGMSPRQTEALALQTMIHIGRRFRAGDGMTDMDSLVAATGSTRLLLERTVADLETGRLLVAVDQSEPGYMPGAPLDRITVEDIIKAVRGQARSAVPHTAVEKLVDTVMQDFEASLENHLRRQTLDELVSRIGSGHEESCAPG